MTSKNALDRLNPLFDHLRPAWRRSDWQVRREAVREMLDKARLRQIAQSDIDERVRKEALERLADPKLDEEIATRRRSLFIAVVVILVGMFLTKNVFRPRGAGGMGPPPVNSQALKFVDELVEQLESANIAFNAPMTVRLGDRTVIELFLSSDFSMEDLQKEITAGGEKHGCRIRVANHMRAELWGDGFTSEAILPQEQLVSTAKTTEWRWNVQAIRSGEQVLYLTLSAIFYLDGGTTPYVVKTFERKINVQVVWTRWMASFIGQNWQWLWTALLIPVAGWVIHKRRKKERKPRSRHGRRPQSAKNK